MDPNSKAIGVMSYITELETELAAAKKRERLLREALIAVKDWLLSDEVGGVMKESDFWNEPFNKALRATRLALEGKE